jgi:parallel beta-helix repeat protein
MKYWVLAVLLAPSVLACVVPENGMVIDSSLEFCSDVYYSSKGIVISGTDIFVDCNSAVLKTWNGNNGILIENSVNVTVTGCRIISFQTGIHVRNSSKVILTDNHLIKNEVGTRFDLVSDSAVSNFDVSLRMPFELIESKNNAVSLLNKRVEGDFCADNFCNEQKNSMELFVQSKTVAPDLGGWLLEQIAGKKTAQRLHNWVFDGFSTPVFVQQ